MYNVRLRRITLRISNRPVPYSGVYLFIHELSRTHTTSFTNKTWQQGGQKYKTVKTEVDKNTKSIHCIFVKIGRIVPEGVVLRLVK